MSATRDELGLKSNAELVDIYNSKHPDQQLKKPWKSGKASLIERILGEIAPPPPPEEKAPEAPKPKKAKGGAKSTTSSTKRTGEIREYVEKLLLEAKGTDEDSRPLGLPYAVILERVQKRFPEAVTSMNCLRWYAAKMNKQGRPGGRPGTRIAMPSRPISREAAA